MKKNVRMPEMSDAKDWARSEVELIRTAFHDDKVKDYAMACYETALKAFEAVCDAGLTGLQVPVVKQIFDALIDRRPLSRIEDVPEIWSDELIIDEEKGKVFQCTRRPSLFKYVHGDGTVTYSDVERVTVHEQNTDTYWQSGFITRMVDERFPIVMPYSPPKKKYVVHVKEYLTDRKNGDFDTIAVDYIDTPDGDTVNIYKYYAEDDTNQFGWRWIYTQEFCERVRMHNDREAKERAEHEDRKSEG